MVQTRNSPGTGVLNQFNALAQADTKGVLVPLRKAAEGN
jgi:hypothetical protein